MRGLLLIVVAVGCAAVPAGAGPAAHGPAATEAAAAQCRRTDRTISRLIRFERGRTSAVIKNTVRLCTQHEYRLGADARQTMTVHLATGRRTSFTLQRPSGDTVEGADGVKDWSGELPEAGEYFIIIGTDATAAYTLEVTIR